MDATASCSSGHQGSHRNNGNNGNVDIRGTFSASTSTHLAAASQGTSSMLTPVNPASSASPIQSATSPRLMPAKSRPTTALVFRQQDEPLHLSLQQQQQETESLSSDEFALSSSSSTNKDSTFKGISSAKQSIARSLQGLALKSQTDDGRLADHDDSDASSDVGD
ncbi:hypothetical protein BGZ68_002681, partial [Mortierella alpina]